MKGIRRKLKELEKNVVSDYPEGDTYITMDNDAEKELHDKARKIQERWTSNVPDINYFLDTSKTLEEVNAKSKEYLDMLEPYEAEILDRSMKLSSMRIDMLFLERLTFNYQPIAKAHVYMRFLWFITDAKRFSERVDFEERYIHKFTDDTTDEEYAEFDTIMKQKFDTPKPFSSESWDLFYKKYCWPSIEEHIRKKLKNIK